MMGDMIRARRSAEKWKRIVREQQVSGLSVAAFCRQARVPQASFYFWRKKSRGDRRLPGVRRARARGGRFVEVKVSAESSPAAHADFEARWPSPSAAHADFEARWPSPSGVHAGVIELRLGGERSVMIRPGFDRRTLIELLAVLEHGVCGGVALESVRPSVVTPGGRRPRVAPADAEASRTIRREAGA